MGIPDEWRYEVNLIKAEADGVGPSLLVSASGKGKGPQYLFNVPEGFSRLVLEHKLRPSSRLASVFLTSLRPHCAGGLGGLLLRLADDGHGQLQLIGPDCSSLFLHSLRHILYWRHPKVFVSDCHPSRPLPVFDDDFVTICPILLNNNVAVLPCGEHGKQDLEECKVDTKHVVCAHSRSKFEDRLFRTIFFTSSDYLDDSTCSSSEGSEPLESHEDTDRSSEISQCEKMRGRRYLIHKDGYQRGSEILCNDTKIVEGNETQVDDCHRHGCNIQEMEFGSSNSKQSSNCNANKRKNDCAGNLVASNSEEICKDQKEYSESCIAMAQVKGLSNKKGIRRDYCAKGSNITEAFFARCKRKRGITTWDQSTGGSATIEQVAHEGNVHITPLTVKDRTHVSKYEGQETVCQWRINNKFEMELPDLPDGTNPLYIKSPDGNVTLVGEELVKQIHLAMNSGEECQPLSKANEILGFVCYMKKLQSAMVVVNCEMPELIDQLYKHPILSCILSPNSYCKGRNCYSHSISAVIHLSPPCVLKSKKYISWMNQLGDGILQITMHGGPAEFGFHCSFATLAKLNMVNKEIFPLPFNVSSHAKQADTQNFENFGLNRQVKAGQMLMRVVFQGKKGKEIQVVVDDSTCQDNTNVDLIQKAFAQSKPSMFENIDMARGDMSELSQNTYAQMSANNFSEVVVREKLLMLRKSVITDSTIQDGCTFPSSISIGNHLNCSNIRNADDTFCNGKTRAAKFKLFFLGTGSAEPSKYRGSSGILLQTHQCRTSILLDAGEGVAGQILRAFGKDEMKMVIKGLQCVWISHKHADHVLGTVSIIASRTENARELLVVGSTAVHEWLLEVHLISRRLGYPLPPFTFVHCKELMGHHNESIWHKKQSYDDPISTMLENLQLYSILCVSVDHCFESCGLVLSSVSGWSIVYSGDTRPCGRLIEAGIGCTLLIHEATFEDKFESHARTKRHCTISEALEVGQQMGAQHVILTHFSQRSPQVITIDTSKHDSASMAFDGMVVCSTHLVTLPRLMQCLVSLFVEYNSNVQDQGPDTGDSVNQDKQFLGASSEGASSLPKALYVMKNIDKGDDIGNFANNETEGGNTKAITTEHYCLPKHIRWEDSEFEDD